MTGVVLYEAVTDIAEDYFGPAAPRFVNRLIDTHVKKNPRNLTPQDLPQLIQWIKPTLASITDNEAAVKEFVIRLDNLRKQSLAN